MRRRRGLSEEEARLWSGVARQTVPLPGKALPDLEDIAPPEPARPQTADRSRLAAFAPPPVKVESPRPKSQMPAYQPPVSARAQPTGPGLPSLHPIERPVKRKIGAGRVAIEDRIDLHDKTQIVAHYALLGFLRQAQGLGLRHVLVITGRGASFGSRGVIKRSLPHWFGTPEFRALVAGFEPAERHHGGDGAFYIRVRRR